VVKFCDQTEPALCDLGAVESPLSYLLRKTDDHRDTTKDIIETDQGDVARLIAINNPT
jgi:hypothetical protein